MVFPAVELKLTLNGLKSYSKRKLLEFEVQKLFFVDKTVTNDLADKTT